MVNVCLSPFFPNKYPTQRCWISTFSWLCSRVSGSFKMTYSLQLCCLRSEIQGTLDTKLPKWGSSTFVSSIIEKGRLFYDSVFRPSLLSRRCLCRSTKQGIVIARHPTIKHQVLSCRLLLFQQRVLSLAWDLSYQYSQRHWKQIAFPVCFRRVARS